MSKPKNKRYCGVYGCKNKRENSELCFFTIPKDIERRREWVRAIDRRDLLSEEKFKKGFHYVCSAHFDESDMETFKKLHKDATPTKYLPRVSREDEKDSDNDDEEIITISSTSTQTSPQCSKKYQGEGTINKLSENDIIYSSNIRWEASHLRSDSEEEEETLNKTVQTENKSSEKNPYKQKFKQDHSETKTKRIKLDQERKLHKDTEAYNQSSYDDSEDEFNLKFKKILKWKNKVKSNVKGNQFDTEFKIFALNLHYSNPQAYRCAQTFLGLPSKRTLSLMKLKISPKLDDRIFDRLSLKLKSLPANAKYCTICVDKMVLKRSLYYDIKNDKIIGLQNINETIRPDVASNAYVIMLQGIYFNWKQPIAYAFLANTEHYEEIDTWIYKVIVKLFSVGINVKAMISKQEPNFDKYAEEIKNITVEKPYFFVNGHKIFYIFDVPHLLKCIRNDLIAYNFYYKGNIISWDHIKELYEYEKEKNLRLIPKITHAHVEPSQMQKTQTIHAAQIFSYSFYAALETYIDFGKITEEVRGTAKFIKTMDQLFDVLNSSTIRTAKKLRTAFHMSADQKSILQEAQNMFALIKATNNIDTNQNTTFKHFSITIQAIIQLFEDLKLAGFQFFFTRRLNQDSMETFFGEIRDQDSFCSEPTPIQFVRAFCKLFHESMLKSEHINYESDIYKMLLKADDLIKKQSLRVTEESTRTSLVLLDGDIDHQLDLPEKNSLIYVAGFLLFKCYQKHQDCQKMARSFKPRPNLDHTQYQFKAYNKNKSFYGKLKLPSQEIIEYVFNIEKAFACNIAELLPNNSGSEIYKLLKTIPTPKGPCPCFPLEYFLKLFVRLRIFSTLKLNNRYFKTSKKTKKQNFKVKQLS